ncbi:MAG: glycosyltransferase family 39 protein [Anaerolineales bacterium]|nr:glycosyltransferase family 39 protein [Anaerolineales bacterium]
MQKHWIFGVFVIGLTGFAIWGLPTVPFHPDEATYLFMSKDLETLFSQPDTLGFDEGKREEQAQIYRTIDAPLTRYLLGLGRLAFGLAALPTDWDWGMSWGENAQAGALPSEALLFTGRLAVTLLLPFSLLMTYTIARKLGGVSAGWVAGILFGLNALTLLHTRRAMAEGPLVFGVLFALWSFLNADQKPWLAGLGMAVAYNSKQSALALLPLGVLAVIWTKRMKEAGGAEMNPTFADKVRRMVEQFVSPANLRQVGRQLVLFFVIFGTVTFALNPVYWQNTGAALRASVTSRAELLSRQVADAERLAPEQLLESPGERLAVLLGQLYVLPLQFFEVGNYQTQTATMVQGYLAIPEHTLFRGLIGGGVLLSLTILGMVRGGIEIARKGITRTRGLVFLFLATGLMGGGLLLVVPLPYQRYSLSLLPLVILWMGLAIKGKK